MNGYRVTTLHRGEHVFSCPSCIMGESRCQCLHQALAFSRRCGHGSSVYRGTALLSQTLSDMFAQLSEADRAERRALREQRKPKRDPSAPQAMTIYVGYVH